MRKIEWKRNHFIPKDAVRQDIPDVPASVEVFYFTHSNKPSAVAFKGRAQTPAINEIYYSDARRDQRIKEWLEGLNGWEKMKADRKAKIKGEFVSVQIGDILHTSWGYDQTNGDWYQVTGRTNGTITIRPIASSYKETGFMSGSSTPQPGRFTGPPEVRHSLNDSKKSWRNLYKWDGEPAYES